MKLAVIIPAFNEEKNIKEVIFAVKKYTDNIIVVDDSSRDKTREIALQAGAKVYSHLINRGLGGALGTGIKAAIKQGADIIVTIDADGQHDPDELPNIIKPIQNNEADVVIGSRFLENQDMPIARKIGNYFFNIFTFSLFAAKCTDTQSGFRAFNKKAAESLQIATNGMEVSSEIIKEVKVNDFRLKEISIKAIYTSYSLSKGQGFFMGIRTLIKLIILKLIG